MKREQRAAQLWSILALAAKNRQVLTYGILARLTGVPRRGQGQLLEPIQSYCMLKKLPPLTAIVVNDETGLPGSGFTAASDVPKTQLRVFDFNWLTHGAPAVEEFERALKSLPTRVSMVKP